MALDPGQLATAMIGALKQVFEREWPQLRSYAEGEAQKLAHSLVQIGELRLSGQIDEGEAAILFEMQKNATRQVLLTVKGMGLLAVEQGINAAVAAVRDVVNKAIGFALL